MTNSLFRRLIRTLVFTSTFFDGFLNQPVLSGQEKKKKKKKPNRAALGNPVLEWTIVSWSLKGADWIRRQMETEGESRSRQMPWAETLSELIQANWRDPSRLAEWPGALTTACSVSTALCTWRLELPWSLSCNRPFI